MSQEQKRDHYHTLIVGSSGRGKTYSARNMDPNTTGFIDVENKPSPFKKQWKYRTRIEKKQGAPEPHQQVLQAIKEYALNPEIKAIVIDSFSAYLDLILAYAKLTKKNYDIWAEYSTLIGLFMEFVKKAKKECYVIAHDEPLGIDFGREKRVKVKGKEWEGWVEKEFTIVVFAEAKKELNRKPDYYFSLYSADTSAKIPPDIFGPDVLTIPNDIALLDKAIKKYASEAA